VLQIRSLKVILEFQEVFQKYGTVTFKYKPYPCKETSHIVVNWFCTVAIR